MTPPFLLSEVSRRGTGVAAQATAALRWADVLRSSGTAGLWRVAHPNTKGGITIMAKKPAKGGAKKKAGKKR